MQNRNNKRLAVLCGAVATVAGLYGVGVPMAQAATTGFNQTTTGPWDYNDPANWVGGTINGTWDSSLTLAAAQTVQFAADTTLTTGLSFGYTGNFALTLDSASATAHTMTLGGDIAVNPASNQTVTIGNGTNKLNVNLGGATRTFTVNPNKTLVFANAISGTNSTDGITFTGGKTTPGGGTLSLASSSSSYTGATDIIGYGILSVSKLANGGSNSSIGASTNAASNLLISVGTGNGTLQYTGSGDSTDRLFTIFGAGSYNPTLDASGSGAINFTNTGAIAFTSSQLHTGGLGFTGSNTDNNTFAPTLKDAKAGAPLSVSKSGAGTWVLTGANTYTGGTTVSAGTLIAANTTAGQSSTGTGSVTLNGGTLASTAAATSYISGTVIAGTAAHTIAPGNLGSIGQLNVGGLNLNSFSTLNFDINSLSHDLLQDTGSLTIAALSTPNVSLTTSGTLSGNYTLATFTTNNSLSNSSFNFLNAAPAGYSWTVTPTTLELDVTAAHSASFAFSTTAPGGSAMIGTENPVDPANPPGVHTGSVITLTGAGGGNYNPGYLNNVTANGNNGYVQINNFSNGDSQIAALSITVNGSAPTAAQLAEILSDLGANAEAFATNSANGSFATALQTSNPGAYNALMAGDVNFATDPFQIALLNPSGLTPGSPAYLAMDFSNEIDAGNSISNVVVTNIAAIPEPAGLSLVGLAAAATLTRRRRKIGAEG
jgi:fibronectin-binding autotransporter adhesin